MKKKFLAFLLTLMTVAVLVPAIVASAVVVPLNAEQTQAPAADERAEVAVHDPLLDEDNVEVLNKNGVRVGYYATLEEAVANLYEGDTVKLLDNVAILSTVVIFNSIVLDGNGYMLSKGEPAPVEPELPEVEPEEPENPEPEQPENQEPENELDPVVPAPEQGGNVTVWNVERELSVAISVTGGMVEIRNLIVNVPDVAVAINYTVDDGAVSSLTLNNCTVMAADCAVQCFGENAHLTVKGAGSSYLANYAVAVMDGFADIYGGAFIADTEVVVASNATVAIYGGTFQLGASVLDVIGAYDNATVILAGGEYATTAESGACVIGVSESAVKVLDGKFYLADAGVAMIGGAGAEVYGGFFYAQESVDLSGATVAEAYAERTYAYEDPTFPANTKLEYVKELGYLAMTQVAYNEAWLAANGYNAGTAYDVTNGVYNEYPVSYYAFELERAFWYLGNGGALTVTQSVELTFAAELNYRNRPQTSVVTLNSIAAGDGALTLNVNVNGGYAFIATGGTYNITNLKLINKQGSAVMLDQNNTDNYGSVLNLQKGASVAGYSNNAIWVGAYATLNVYNGAYVSAAAGVNGAYDGTGFGLIAMIGGELNVYGGAIGYERAVDENGRYFDRICTASMNTVAVGVGDAATCVSSINVYNGKLGNSPTDMSNNATAIFNLTDQSERIDGTKLYIENGVFNAPMNSIIRCNGRDIEILIKDGTFNGSTAQCTSASHSDLIWVTGISADVHNTLVVEGGTFTGGRDQFNINGYARVSISNTNHSGARSAVFSLLGNPDSEPVNVTNVTVNATVVPFYCDGSKLNVTGGEFTILRSSWGHCGFQLASNAATAGDITVTGGVYNIQNGYFVTNNGSAKRTVTLNNVSFNNVNNGSGICMNDSGGADVIVNGGVFSNMTGSNHLIETYGNPDKAVGSLTINGDARFVKGGSASGRMIKYYGANNVTINGGYFQSSTSETMVVEKSGNHSYEPTLTLTINGGTFYNNAAGYGLIYFNSNATAALVVNGGTFLNEAGNASSSWAPCLDYNSKTPANIYGGDFASICPEGISGSDACVSVGTNATLNVYAGTFRANGMCVIRGLAGKTDGETNVNGSIQTAANCHLNIYGGVFTLENNTVRTAGNYGHDAVVRCGGGSTYAFVCIYGGTFIDNSKCSNQVISKNNVHSSITITGGVFLASEAQEYYFKSNGMAATGGSENPKTPLEKSANDPVVNYGGKQYNQLVYGTGASPFNGKMENGAQIRVVEDEDGNAKGGIRFVTRYSAASVASLKSLAGGTLDNVSFGTLIVETALLEGVTFNHAGLAAANVAYIDIAAQNGIAGSETDGYSITAALSDITAENYQTAYSALGYTKVTLPDGGVVYFYTEYVEEHNSRSIAQVAAAALADVSDSQTKGYVYPHVTMDGMFSRYTVEEQTVMMSYIATPEVE